MFKPEKQLSICEQRAWKTRPTYYFLRIPIDTMQTVRIILKSQFPSGQKYKLVNECMRSRKNYENGGCGHRSRYLAHAKRALYHLS